MWSIINDNDGIINNIEDSEIEQYYNNIYYVCYEII